VNCVSVPSLQWSEERMKRVMNEGNETQGTNYERNRHELDEQFNLNKHISFIFV